MLKEAFESISKKMTLDFSEVTSRINHNGEKGTARENVLQNYLRNYIPDKYNFSKGTIIDCNDNQSRQVDIIIHDKYTTPCLIDMDSTKVIPVESVYAVIEVKSTLTKEELRKSIENINSVKQLKKNTIVGVSYPTAGLVFAYDSDASLDSIYKNVVELSAGIEPENRVSCVCVLNKGIIILADKHGLNKVSLLPNVETVYAMMKNEEDSLLLFYLILIQLLTQIQVYPPDMVKYAQSSKMLDTAFNIPAEYLPEDATLEVLDAKVSIADLRKLQEAGKRMLSGELEKHEILHCAFETYIPSLKMMHGSLENVPQNSTLNYFGYIISNKKLVELYYLFKKGEAATPYEKTQLSNFEDALYVYYMQHSDEMKKNSKKQS